ncbi:MAG: hypothetical protein IPG51_14600 [Chloroflexi bacterium]|nr:hypothetical protein [Chloroflexota bacterium]MBK8931370.1 hypothetical protein [Chloroflexota bacterium]
MEDKQTGRINPSKLRDLMREHYNLAELQEMCTDLGVDYEDIAGDTLHARVHNLVRYFKRQNRLEKLVQRSKELRPAVDWDSVYDNGPIWRAATRRNGVWGTAVLLILVLAAGVYGYASSGRFCAYRGEDDYATIIQIIKAESQAVNSGNLQIITAIFAPDAYLRQTEKADGSIKEWFDPLARYSALFETTTFQNARHQTISGTVNGNYARFTSGSYGNYTTGEYHGEYANEAGNPDEEEVWTLEKNFYGCWRITRFEFH